MKRFKLPLTLLLLLLFLILSSPSAQAATPPDIIHKMNVAITPQKDGSLTIHYELDYEATTDFPSDIRYLEVGVPNTDFTLLDYGPSTLISGAKENKNGTSQVHLDFMRLPKADDRFQLEFTINQRSMIYQEDDFLSFQFRPGWFDFAEIDEMKVTLETSLLNNASCSPAPSTTDGALITWITYNMGVNQKTSLYTITCDKTSFPGLQEKDLISKPSDADTIIGIIVVIIICIFIGFLIIISKSNGYQKGRYAGGYKGGALGAHHTFRGGGTGCACACACACAGGGRVGCSERGYQVLHWLIKSGHSKCNPLT